MSEHKVVHVEISAKDPGKAGEFYKALFGWKIHSMEAMDYTMFDDGGTGGGFSKVGENTPEGSVLIYISTDDIDASLAKAEALGGKIIMPKTEIPQTGWFGIFEDPSGNQLGVYTGLPQE